MLVGEPPQHLYAVIANGEDGDVLTLEIGEAALQLNELRLAKGSPSSAAIKDYEGPVASAGLVQTQCLPILVWQHHIRKTCSKGWTNGTKVNAEIRHCSHSFFPHSPSPSGDGHRKSTPIPEWSD